MTAPAFTCRCIKLAEAVSPGWPYNCDRRTSGHIAEFGEIAWQAHNSRYAFLLMRAHYEAHALGAPHSHIKYLKGNDAFRSGFSWDPVACSCHHVEQNTTVNPDVMQRGPGLTNVEYIASAP